MERKNRYIACAKISESKTRFIVRLFALDLIASQISELSRVNRNTVNRLVLGLRERIAVHCDAGLATIAGSEILKPAPPPARTPALAAARQGIFLAGITAHNGLISTEMVPSELQETALRLLRNRGDFSLTRLAEPWPGYDSLVDLGRRKYTRIKYNTMGSVRHGPRIAMPESFWGFAKNRLTRFRGLHRHTLYHHLKECEFRFNFRDQNLYRMLLALLREYPLSSS